MHYFNASLILEDKYLKFAGRNLEDGAAVSAGFGTVGGGATASRRKRNHQEAILSELIMKLSDSADGIISYLEWAITRLFLQLQF